MAIQKKYPKHKTDTFPPWDPPNPLFGRQKNHQPPDIRHCPDSAPARLGRPPPDTKKLSHPEMDGYPWVPPVIMHWKDGTFQELNHPFFRVPPWKPSGEMYWCFHFNFEKLWDDTFMQIWDVQINAFNWYEITIGHFRIKESKLGRNHHGQIELLQILKTSMNMFSSMKRPTHTETWHWKGFDVLSCWVSPLKSC